MNYKLRIWVLLLILSSCCKDDPKSNIVSNDKGEIISLPFQWKIPIHENGSNYNSSFNNNMVFGDKVLIPRTTNAESRKITMIDSKDGSIIWDWAEWYQPTTETVSYTWNARYANYLHWTTGTRRYTIHTETGETILRHRNTEDRSFSARITNDKSTTYMINSHKTADGYLRSSVFKGSMLDDHYEEFLNVPYSIDTVGEENRIKGIVWVEPYQYEGKDYLVVKSGQPYLDWYYDSRMNLYNLTEEKWEYTDKIAAKPKQNNSGWMKIYNNNFYFTSGAEMFCYEIMTGKQLWKRAFSHDFTFSGFEIVDDILVANCENLKSYGIDANFGNLIWQSEGSGTSSHLNNRIMDGVVYFKGGSPAFLFAKDIYTGETLWKLDPYLFESSNARWTNSLNVIPGKNGEKGKVVVVSGTHAYCFEAAK